MPLRVAIRPTQRRSFTWRTSAWRRACSLVRPARIYRPGTAGAGKPACPFGLGEGISPGNTEPVVKRERLPCAVVAISRTASRGEPVSLILAPGVVQRSRDAGKQPGTRYSLEAIQTIPNRRCPTFRRYRCEIGWRSGKHSCPSDEFNWHQRNIAMHLVSFPNALHAGVCAP